VYLCHGGLLLNIATTVQPRLLHTEQVLMDYDENNIEGGTCDIWFNNSKEYIMTNDCNRSMSKVHLGYSVLLLLKHFIIIIINRTFVMCLLLSKIRT